MLRSSVDRRKLADGRSLAAAEMGRRRLGRASTPRPAADLTDFGLSLETHRTLGELTAAEKQEIAIAGALARRARLVILDEPTASLTEPEVKRLFSHLRRLRGQGVTILYVSHRLDEIFELTDRIVVLRDGSLVAMPPHGRSRREAAGPRHGGPPVGASLSTDAVGSASARRSWS